MAKPALGRGLGALLGGAPKHSSPAASSSAAPISQPPGQPVVDPRDRVQHMALDRVRPCPFQPRKEFSQEALQELADSIREQGIIQPLIVREKDGAYELIAGERRWRAAQLAGLKDVPIIVRQATDAAVLELALIENLQRENLNPMEEALGYSQLISQFNLRQEDVASRVGKSRAVVANALRLLKLAPELQGFLRDGKLSVGHAKVILGLPNADQQKLAADNVIKTGSNVRQTEEMVAHLQQAKAPATHQGPLGPEHVGRDAHVVDLENRLR
ncbi:MAG: parB-like partition protein, partial [Verrucomicrobiales bacterium]|nr:parB-like partition protein [Verrucomicrobiales bacterium]